MNALRNPPAGTPVGDNAHHVGSLAASLPLDDLVTFFSGQLATYVRYDSFSYDNPLRATHVRLGTAGIHSCNYQLRTEGLDAGRVTLTRGEPFSASEINRIECALGVLSMQLGKAIDILRGE